MKSVWSKLAIIAFASFALTACGSDSTGPSNLDATSALRSLAIGLRQTGGTGTIATLQTDESFGGIAPFLNQVTVDIGGSSRTMFALALRQSFPDGTCWSNFYPANSTDPGSCIRPPLGLLVVLWQSHSPSERPDRMAIIVGDVGISDFSFDTGASLPAVAIYTEGGSNVWVSESGTLTSAVSATPVSCNLPLPPYVKSGTCSIATFDEQGSVVLAAFNEVNGADPFGPKKMLTIPRQTLHGLWMQISAVQPVGFTADRGVAASVQRLLKAGLISKRLQQN